MRGLVTPAHCACEAEAFDFGCDQNFGITCCIRNDFPSAGSAVVTPFVHVYWHRSDVVWIEGINIADPMASTPSRNVAQNGDTGVTLTPAELTRRTIARAPRIAELATEAERLHRPTDEGWGQSGCFCQFTPKAFGGMASDLETLPIAAACSATACRV